VSKNSVVSTVILILCAIGLLLYSNNLIQDNREDLFLSQSFKEKLQEDRKTNPVYDAIVLNLSFEDESKWGDFHQGLLDIESKFDDLTWLSPQVISDSDDFNAQQSFFSRSSLLKFVDGSDAIFFFYLDSHDPEKRENLVASINRLCSTLELEPRFGGMPYLNVKLGEMSLQIKKVVMPILFIVVAVLLRLILGSSLLTLVCFVPSLFGVGLSLSLIKIFWGHSTMVTTLVPILVFLVLLSLTLHLALSSVFFQDIKKAWREKRLAIILALATTLLGLFSLVISDIPAIRQFAITSCVALFLSAIVGLYYWYKLEISFTTEKIQFSKLVKKLEYPLPLTLCFFFVLLSFGGGFLAWKKTTLQVEALYFFPTNSQMVRNWRQVEKQLGGMPLLDIHYHVGDYNDETLKKISTFEDNLSAQLDPGFKILSPHEIVKEANSRYANTDEVPESLAAYQLLLGRVPRYFRPSFENGVYTLSILGRTTSTQDYNEWISSLELPHNARLGGLYYWMMRSQQGLIKAMTQSFFWGLVCVTLFLVFMFKSFAYAGIFFVVNIIPACCTLSVFYLLGKDLNIASITTFSISFGLIVDSTLHLLVHYRRHGNKQDEFVSKTVFAPIFVVTTVMVIGFSLLGLYNFSPVGDFGLAMGITLFFGFILDFYILPTLVSSQKR
jgi:uncharacterized protein